IKRRLLLWRPCRRTSGVSPKRGLPIIFRSVKSGRHGGPPPFGAASELRDCNVSARPRPTISDHERSLHKTLRPHDVAQRPLAARPAWPPAPADIVAVVHSCPAPPAASP